MVARPASTNQQTYNTDWSKVKGWAAAEKIPTAAVANVQALDQNRLAAGTYPMSNAERTRAILAAAGMNYNTALPTDSPPATNILGNTVANARGIATGLMPTRLVANIFDTLKTTVHAIEDPASLKGKTTDQTLSNALEKTALSWVPGLYDIGVVAGQPSLGAGLDALAKQPITSILDVMPAIKALDTGVGRAAAQTATGDALAARMGIASKALGQKGMVRIAGSALGSVKIGHKMGFVWDADGNEVLATKTLAQRATDRLTSMGLGKPLSDASHYLMSGNNEMTHVYRQQIKDLQQAVAKLTPDVKNRDGTITRGTLDTFNQEMHSGRPANDIINDSKVPLDVRQAVEAYRPVEQLHQQITLESGMIMQVKLPDGSTALYEKTSPVISWVKKADDAHAEADKANVATDQIVDQAKQLDTAMKPVMDKITETKNAVAGTVRMQPQISQVYLKMFGRLTGQGGLLEQMHDALNKGDWRRLRDVAKQANKMMDSPFVKGREAKAAAEGVAKSRAVPAIQGWSHIPQMAELVDNIDKMAKYGQLRSRMLEKYEKLYEGKYKSSRTKSAAYLNEKAAKLDAEVMKQVKKNWQANYRDVVLNKFFENFLASDKAAQNLDAAAADLRKKGYGKDDVARLRRDPRKLYEVIVAIADPTFRDPFIGDMTPADHAIFMNDAINEAEKLRAEASIDPERAPMWVPTVGASGVSRYAADDRIYVNPTKHPTIDSANRKAFDMSSTVNDVMLGVSRAMKQPLERDVTLNFAHDIILPMLHSRQGLRAAILKEHFGEVIDERGATAMGDLDERLANDYGMVPFDIPRNLGIGNEDMGLKEGETYYVPAAMKDQLERMVGRDQFPLKGAWDKATGVFKYSILGLSPRYTAHILFGGSMMLALRIDPRSFAYIGRAAKAVSAYHKGEDGEIDSRVMQGATQRGNDVPEVHFRGGRQMGNLTLQEKLDDMGIDHHVATAAQWAKAAAGVNFRFTNYISDIQRSLAYFDGIKAAERKGYHNDPITGERIPMNGDRAHAEGMMAAERVMGNLQAMTPLERSVARKIMPFYGWTKHVLKYVLSYPIDHPWRTSFLSVLATQNTDNFASGLDTRMQLLFFLGQPDHNGNVSAIDARALDPFRDVANYATLGGWISSMNPILSAPVAYIDPEIIYGGNVLHPNITYDSVYGTNTASAGGSPLGAAEQEIPELSVLDQALGLTAKARSVAKSGGEGKALFQALNIPFAQVQHLNLQQISAKHEIDRYNQAAQAALDAWQSGDFAALLKYPGTVPDPLQKDYNITPHELFAQYQRALQSNPTAPPSETVASLRAPAL